MHKTFGEKLIYHRKLKGWNQKQLAFHAGLPIPTVNTLEKGTRSGKRVAVEIAQRLARALGVSLDYLTGMYEETDETEAMAAATELVGA